MSPGIKKMLGVKKDREISDILSTRGFDVKPVTIRMYRYRRGIPAASTVRARGDEQKDTKQKTRPRTRHRPTTRQVTKPDYAWRIVTTDGAEGYIIGKTLLDAFSKMKTDPRNVQICEPKDAVLTA